MQKYRLYIDESGTHSYSDRKPYLSLNGLIITPESVNTVLQPKIREIKALLTDDPDENVVLHREDIVYRNGAFRKLYDADVQKEFDKRLFALIEELDFTVCCVVIDKKEHYKKYGKAAKHPYHYCLDLLLERYVKFLEDKGTGDVIAESRGRTEDKALKIAYNQFHSSGTYFLSTERIQSCLSSSQIKIKKKELSIAGLELADLLALPTRLDVQLSYRKIDQLTSNFNKKLIDRIQGKYYKDGRLIKGYGKKMI